MLEHSEKPQGASPRLENSRMNQWKSTDNDEKQYIQLQHFATTFAIGTLLIG